MSNIPTDNSGCLSHIYFSNTSYTLSFGHLFEGNLNCYQSFNPIDQCYESYSYKQPRSSSSSNLFNNIQLEKDDKIDKAMKTIRKSIKNIEKQYDYSIPSVPYCSNLIMTNCNQNKITKAGLLLEKAANAMSIVANKQTQFR